MDKEKALKEIFTDDPLGLLNLAAKTSPARTEEERLVASFLEIVDFYEKYNREPEHGSLPNEMALLFRLQGIRENEEKIKKLLPYDRFNLLTVEQKEINSIEDIFNEDTLDLLGSDAEDLFDLKHVQKPDERASTDFVARRKPCKNFEEYEAIFKAVQSDLSTGKRKLIEFSEDNLRPGDFYVHNGVLLLLESVDFKEEEIEYKSGSRVRKDGRSRVIFENGTESNMLYRSLYKALLANGKAVSQNLDAVNEEFTEKLTGITEEDEKAGYIYVLRSKSTRPEIKEIQNLYKIGFSKVEIADRIKNAEQEPTYLMAGVQIVTAFQCYNMNTQKLEQLLHNFFGNSCLNVDVFDSKGNRHTPREWFIAPLEVIEKAIHMIVSGDIVRYRYDGDREMIVER